MAVRLTCTDNATGHDGLRWRMGPDAQSVTTVVGETAPGVGELVVAEPITPEACFSVAAYSGAEEGDAAAVCAEIPADLSAADPGDAVAGGIYVGLFYDQDNDQNVHVIAAKEQYHGLGTWGAIDPVTGINREHDGKSNTADWIALDDSVERGREAIPHLISIQGAEGFGDWYIPAASELAFIQSQIGGPDSIFGGIGTSYVFSSTENTAQVRINIIRWSDGNRPVGDTGASDRVIVPVRRVQA